MQPEAPPVRDLLLIGGGHAHIQVLKAFAMKPLPGLRLTLVSREIDTPYSGMLPGYIAGFYAYDDIHIDLGSLTRIGSVRLVVGEVEGVDIQDREVRLRNHAPLRYDLLSINSGAVPGSDDLDLKRRITPVKPIGRFLPAWEEIRQRSLREITAGRKVSIALVGGGAGGVELALATARNLRKAIGASHEANRLLTLCLVTASSELLGGHNSRTREKLEAALLRRNIGIRYDFKVVAAGEQGLVAEDGRVHPVDDVLWVTGVTAPHWLQGSGLSLDDEGFIRVNDHLQSLSHSNVFAAGDIASLVGQKRPKSGVFAVREGPVLSANLRRAALKQPLRRFRAQKRFLSILALGARDAVASRGVWTVSGPWVWRWKDWIDRRFMARFQNLPDMEQKSSIPRNALTEDFEDDVMRCGGCGSKLGADLLHRVLQRLPPTAHVLVNSAIGDDAAVLSTGSKKLVISTDSFRSMIDDPWVFGRVAVQHSLNDVYASRRCPTWPSL